MNKLFQENFLTMLLILNYYFMSAGKGKMQKFRDKLMFYGQILFQVFLAPGIKSNKSEFLQHILSGRIFPHHQHRVGTRTFKYRVFRINCVFRRIFKTVRPLPTQVLGCCYLFCTENSQPIRVALLHMQGIYGLQ